MSELSHAKHKNGTLEVLTEFSRREYLKAMGIVSWLPKDQPNEIILPENDKLLQSVASQSNTLPEQDIKPLPSTQRNIQASSQSKSEVVEEKERIKSVAVDKQFLKMVNWSHQTSVVDSAKKLLVICRHQVDQPASSFARPNTPSFFMIDYLNALANILSSKKIEVDIQLAHLSQIGLTDDCVAFSEGINSSEPDWILILGDETVKQFINNDSNIADLRGRDISVSETLSACVSYHPFTLIQEPALKRLAFEDLYHLADCLCL